MSLIEQTLDFSDAHILVVGDLMLDQYLVGDVARISPEAPVPVLLARHESSTLGGAANVALNLSRLGVQCSLAGFVGRDFAAQTLTELCKQEHIHTHMVPTLRPTIRKQRIVGGHQQMLRIDFEEPFASSPAEEAELKSSLSESLALCHLVILSDYGKGLCTPSFCAWLAQICKKNGKKLLVDPKGLDWSKYAGASLVTPNFKEFCEALHTHLPNQDQSVESYAPQILGCLDIDTLLVTRSEKGMSLCSGDRCVHVHTEAREVYDVSGAGDTVLATLGAALAMGWELEEAMRLANKAAGQVVAKRGTVPVDLEELRHACRGFSTSKIQDRRDLKVIRKKLAQQGKKVVFTNGCFDIMHRGHLEYLRRSRELGDVLIVGLNDDSSVRRLKGADRPINNQDDRALMLASLEFVDFVVLFSEDTPYELLDSLRPSVLVKGADYAPEQVIGREFADELILMDFVDGYSTTRIVQKMKS